jgi:hypothetical protein
MWLTVQNPCGAECVEVMDNHAGRACLAVAPARHPLHTVCAFQDSTPHAGPFFFCADNRGALCRSCWDATHQPDGTPRTIDTRQGTF